MHVTRMPDFAYGLQPRDEETLCACGGMKHAEATVCIRCHNAENNRRRYAGQPAVVMEHHRQFSAALAAGWMLCELIAMRPVIPTWEQIIERDAGVVIRRVWRQVNGS